MSKDLNDIRRAAFELRATDPNEAVRILRRAVRKGGEFEALAHGALGEILLEEFDDVDGAMHHFGKLRALAPGLPAAELGFARALARSARIEEAQEAYARALSGLEDTLLAAKVAQSADEALPEGVEESLLTALEAAVEERELLREQPSPRAPSTPSAQLLDWAEAARLFDLIDEDGTPDTDDWSRYGLLRGAMLALDGDLDGGLQVIERVTELAPLAPPAWLRLRSLVYEAAGKYPEAARDLRQAVDEEIEILEPDEGLRLAALHTASGEEDAARAVLETIKQANADEPQVVREIDRLLQDLPKPELVPLGRGRFK